MPLAGPKITIITPSLNQGRFLETCIGSVLDQRYENLEYLILDGGSTDQSLEIIRRYEKHLTWWVSEKDAGQSDAINRGFRRASGDLVAWLNADDYYLPEALAHVAEAWRRSPEASFYFGNALRVDEAGNRKSAYFPEGRVLFNRQAMVFGLNYIPQPATFISRRHLEQVGHLDPALHWGMDTDLWLRLSAGAPPAALPQILAASREYGQTKTSTGAFIRIEELRRIAEKHSGVSMTPGAICYLLDTLHRLASERPDIYPPEYRTAISLFWATTSSLFSRWGARPDGAPTRSDGDGTAPPASKDSDAAASAPVRGRRASLANKLMGKLRNR